MSVRRKRLDELTALPGVIAAKVGMVLLGLAHVLAAVDERLVDFGGDD